MRDRLTRKLINEDTKTILLAAGGVVAVTAGLIIAAPIIGCGIGALCGEVLDHTPYFKKAIPEGIAYLTGYINPEASEKSKVLLQGNLDKVGAALGFIGGFFKSSYTSRHKDKTTL